MKEKSKMQIKVVSATNGADFERKFNEVSDELAEYEPEVKMKDGDGFCAYFMYISYIRVPETEEDDFNIHHHECKCCDCPFLEVGTDARRKWFPCKYTEYGETRMDASACDVFYKEAVRLMREKAGR